MIIPLKTLFYFWFNTNDEDGWEINWESVMGKYDSQLTQDIFR